MSTEGNVLVAGPEGPLHAAILRRLRADGFRAQPAEGIPPAPPPSFSPHALVILPASAPTAASAMLSLEDFVTSLDTALADMSQLAKAVLAARPQEPAGRLVLVADWAVSGLPGQTLASAVSGGLLGLARSWALELAPEGVTTNAVVIGPGVGQEGMRPDHDDVAHAISFFLDRRSSAISGQMLSVCGGRTPGLLPF